MRQRQPKKTQQAIQTYLSLCEKVITSLKLTVYHISCKAEFSFTSQFCHTGSVYDLNKQHIIATI